MELDTIVLLVHCLTADGVVCFWPIEATRLMIGKLSEFFEYVLSGNFSPCGAGVSIGGIRARLTGTHSGIVAVLVVVGNLTFIDFNALIDDAGIDLLSTTTFGLVGFGWPFVVAIFAALITLFKPGTGRSVGFGVADTEADVRTTFFELMRCTLIKPPFGAFI